ncbi:type IV pilin N-terminal domain-containing protein, partial [Halorubrum ezzemoulense]
MSRPTTDRAQSETVGIILLLAVFVVSASAIGVAYVGGVGSNVDEVVVSADLSADGSDLRVDHLGGDALPNDELTVVVRTDGNATRYPFAPPPGEFGPGDRRTFSDSLVANASNEVRLY